jgi:hypothetical protein
MSDTFESEVDIAFGTFIPAVADPTYYYEGLYNKIVKPQRVKEEQQERELLKKFYREKLLSPDDMNIDPDYLEALKQLEEEGYIK